MEMLLHFMVAMFLVVPGFIIIGIFLIQMLADAMHSDWLSNLGMIFCPTWERKEERFSDQFDIMYAEDIFFGDGGLEKEDA